MSLQLLECVRSCSQSDLSVIGTIFSVEAYLQSGTNINHRKHDLLGSLDGEMSVGYSHMPICLLFAFDIQTCARHSVSDILRQGPCRYQARLMEKLEGRHHGL